MMREYDFLFTLVVSELTGYFIFAYKRCTVLTHLQGFTPPYVLGGGSTPTYPPYVTSPLCYRSPLVSI